MRTSAECINLANYYSPFELLGARVLSFWRDLTENKEEEKKEPPRSMYLRARSRVPNPAAGITTFLIKLSFSPYELI